MLCYDAGMDTTSASLLIRLQTEQRDSIAWNQFVDLYTPLIFYWGRKAGLQPDDASDLVQEVLTKLVRKLPEFRLDPNKSFRGWLRVVTLNKFRELRRRKTIQIVDIPTVEFSNVEEPADDYWHTSYSSQLVRRAMELAEPNFEPATWRALCEYVNLEVPAAEAAKKHGVSVWTVYSAKSRLLAHLREQLEGLLD